MCYCHDVLQMDTTEAEEYLATARKQSARQTSRRQSGRAQLALQRRCIDWIDVVKGAGTLKHLFEEAKEEKVKATACIHYVLYLFFTMLPPGRGGPSLQQWKLLISATTPYRVHESQEIGMPALSAVTDKFL